MLFTFGLILAGFNGLVSSEKTACVNKDLLQMLMTLKWENCGNNQNGKDMPAFFATLKKQPFTLNGINDVLKFDDARINRGGGYNPSTGVFTAPRNGLYQISSMILSYGEKEVQYHLMKNGSIYVNGYCNKPGHGTQTVSSIMDLKKGDRVYIKHRTNAVQKVYGDHYSTFSGYFIYE